MAGSEQIAADLADGSALRLIRSPFAGISGSVAHERAMFECSTERNAAAIRLGWSLHRTPANDRDDTYCYRRPARHSRAGVAGVDFQTQQVGAMKRETRYGRPANIPAPSRLPAPAPTLLPHHETTCEHHIVGPCPWCESEENSTK